MIESIAFRRTSRPGGAAAALRGVGGFGTGDRQAKYIDAVSWTTGGVLSLL